jgi:hypothetical protein
MDAELSVVRAFRIGSCETTTASFPLPSPTFRPSPLLSLSSPVANPSAPSPSSSPSSDKEFNELDRLLISGFGTFSDEPFLSSESPSWLLLPSAEVLPLGSSLFPRVNASVSPLSEDPREPCLTPSWAIREGESDRAARREVVREG